MTGRSSSPGPQPIDHSGAARPGPMPAVIQVEGISKAYSVPVLSNVSLEVLAGEVHVLMGANGAGKSTLAAIIGGLNTADSGRILRHDRPLRARSRREAQSQGIVMVLQELNLIPTLSVAENLFLDCLPHSLGFVDRKTLHSRARRALARVGLDQLEVATPLGRLGIGQRQLVEIARALERKCELLILDEPTAALSVREVEILFANIRRLQALSVGILYITHRLDELPRIASRVSVLCDGRCVAEYAGGEVAHERLIRDMAGGVVERPSPSTARLAGPMLLSVEGISGGSRREALSLGVRAGEIVGLAGLVGAGRTELLRSIFGADRRQSGTVSVAGGPPIRPGSPRAAVAAGIGMLPEDRRHDGLLLSQSVRVNATLATLSRHSRHGWLDRRSERAAAEGICTRLDVRCAGIEQPVRRLSGGNQQKVVLGRWLDAGCRVLLCDEPTRGVDAAAKATIHARLRAFVADGGAVLLASGELSELRAVCDRVLVMAEGIFVAEFGGEWSDEEVTAAAFTRAFSAEGAGSDRLWEEGKQ